MNNEPISRFVFPPNKKLIIVRGAPTRERDAVAYRVAEFLLHPREVRRVENQFYIEDAATQETIYRYNPEALYDAIAATHRAIENDLKELGCSIAAGTFLRRKHMMEYHYSGIITAKDMLVLEVQFPADGHPTPNESRRPLDALHRLQSEREHFLHAFPVQPDVEFVLPARPKL